jgi:nitronate monooxygenase
VSEAGGLGFVAAGYKTAKAAREELEEVRVLTSRPVGLNLFVPTRENVDEHALASYVVRMRDEAARYRVEVGEPRWTDDEWEAKLEVAAGLRPAVVSFTFGCPEEEIVDWLQSRGCRVWCTVTSASEAAEATARRVDALVVQGAEAGGHQGSFHELDDEPTGLLRLIAVIRSASPLPLVAAGGVSTPGDLAAALRAGAVAAQIGTALLRTSEAGTSAAHRAALEGDAETRLTRAFTGRRARGIVNRFMLDHDAFAPRGYPEIHFVTAPIRAAAREHGDPDGMNLWAGTGYRTAAEGSASELVERWGEELRPI